jgi:hypothetical protein
MTRHASQFHHGLLMHSEKGNLPRRSRLRVKFVSNKRAIGMCRSDR